MSNSTWIYLPSITLYVLLLLTVLFDCKNRRIPNKIVFPGAIVALVLHTTIPNGSGFFSAPFGGIGFVSSLAGLTLGLAFLLPMYALRAMGAGDVKLMAMIGAFFGPIPLINIALFTFLAGGTMAILVALWNRTLVQVFANLRHMVTTSLLHMFLDGKTSIDKPTVLTGKLPYACAIAAGVIAHLATANLGHNFL